jgi:DNA replication protein DnaC
MAPSPQPQPQLLLENYLKQLRLPSFAELYQQLAQDAARTDLSYERFLLALVQEEVARRERNSVERAIRQAHFPVLKELADFEWSAVPDLSKPRVLELAQGGYISGAESVLLIGNPGLGKTHLASALALAACRQGKRVRFYNVAGLVNELVAAQQEYRLSRFMAASLKQHLIVLDELGFIPFTSGAAQLLFQFVAGLYERVAVIVTTNLRFAEWSSVMGGDERMSAALLDRLTHRAHILELRGSSYRFRQQLKRGEGEESGTKVLRDLEDSVLNSKESNSISISTATATETKTESEIEAKKPPPPGVKEEKKEVVDEAQNGD